MSKTQQARARETFDSFYESLTINIQNSVLTLADEALSEFLLTSNQLQQCLKTDLTDYEKADALLQMIGAKIDQDADVLGQFMDILRRHAHLSHLVEGMEKHLQAIT